MKFFEEREIPLEEDKLGLVRHLIDDVLRACQNAYTEGAVLPSKKSKNEFVTELAHFLQTYQPERVGKDAYTAFVGELETRIAALDQAKLSKTDKAYFQDQLENLKDFTAGEAPTRKV